MLDRCLKALSKCTYCSKIHNWFATTVIIAFLLVAMLFLFSDYGWKKKDYSALEMDCFKLLSNLL